MKLIHVLIATSALILSGCGHSRLYESEFMGAALEIPIGDGSAVIGIGTHKTTRALLRGGAALETTTSVGGGLFGAAAGQSKILHLKTNAQLNEGYLQEVLISPECPSEAKVELAKNLRPAAEAPYFPGAILQTKEATIHLGKNAILSNNVEKLTGHTGVDLLVETVGSVVGTNVVNNVLDTTGGVVHDVTNPLEGTVSEVSETVTQVDNTVQDLHKSVVTIVCGVIAAMLLFIVIVVLFKKGPTEGRRRIIVPPCPTEDPKGDDSIMQPVITDATFHGISETSEVVDEVLVVNPKPKVPFSEKLKKAYHVTVKVVKKIISWILLIPPPVRKKIAEKAIQFLKDYKAKRDAAKKSKKK